MKLNILNENNDPRNRFNEPISHEPPADRLVDPERHETGGKEYQKWAVRTDANWDQFQAHLRDQGAQIDRVIESALINPEGHIEELQIVRHKDKWDRDRPDLDILRGRWKGEDGEWGEWSEFTETQGHENVQRLMDEYLSFGNVEYHIKHE